VSRLLGPWVAAAVLAACAREPAPPPARSVVVVTIDTLRADAVGPNSGTPALAAFLETATRFRRARTPVPLTLPAHVSLFTGLLPAAHGVHDNLAPPVPYDRPFRFLAEEFRERGYATAAFVSCAVIQARTGLHAGFETYDCAPAPAPELALSEYGEREGGATVAAALHWLAARAKDRPFFLWVHLFDPHEPYRAFPGDARRPGTTDADPDAVRYAGEVRRADAALEPLFAALPEDAIVVVASDHGEALGEHGERTHGILCFGATADVLLAVRGPGFARGAVDDAPRSLCDVAPTIRALCGIGGEPRLLRPASGPVVTESIFAWRMHGFGQCFAAADGRRSLVESGPALELFDLEADPGERIPVNDAEAFEPLDRAIIALRDLGKRDGDREGPAVISPYGSARRPETHYLPRRENGALPDPRTKLAYIARFERARLALDRAYAGRDAEALREGAKEMEALTALEPGDPAPWYGAFHAHARVAAVSGDTAHHRFAARAAREALVRGYVDDALVYHALGQSLFSGELDEMRATLRAVRAAGRGVTPECLPLLQRIVLRLAESGDTEALAIGREILNG
jgi:arylsulfatase A-like enzyme